MSSLLEPTFDEWYEVPLRAIELYEAKKAAYSPTMRGIGEAIQMLPSKTIPSAPAPLTSMLAGGMLGAGLGYGAGWLGEKLLPGHEPGRLRRTLATLGGVTGAVPGALWAYGSKSLLPPAVTPEKAALWDGTAAAEGGPLLNVNEFNQVIWTDPRVAPHVSLPVRAAASGFLLGAKHLSSGEGDDGMISPLDVGRMAVGMGTGYLSGALVGKTLGLLTGMPESQQNLLKNTGMYAGIVNAVVPKLFGR